MIRNGPVIVIEDDTDDQESLSEVFKNLNYSNELLFFNNGQSALDYLTSSDRMMDLCHNFQALLLHYTANYIQPYASKSPARRSQCGELRFLFLK